MCLPGEGMTGYASYMPSDVSIHFSEHDDSECALIKIRNIGSVSEQLRVVAEFSQSDIRRMLDAIKEAETETQRIDPDRKTIECLDHLTERLLWTDEDPTRLQVSGRERSEVQSYKQLRMKAIPATGMQDPKSRKYVIEAFGCRSIKLG